MFRDDFHQAASKKKDPIKHVVYLMMENQSFDRKLGSLKKIKPALEGVDPSNPHYNLDRNGARILQKETSALQMPLDPLHDVDDVAQQLNDHNGGFVKNFIANYPNSGVADRQEIMGYYPYGFLPALHPLATEFTVCDHWFASVPGPTWTNRFFALSGTSMGRVNMLNTGTDFKDMPELFMQTQTNIFDRLDEKGISWRCYCGDFPIALVLTHDREPRNLINFRNMEKFYEDVKGPADDFPQFSFIEPKYLNKNQNDDHPPHNTMRAEQLIAHVYNAIRANNELWMSILFILVYDEHGGFYDHVVPPKATPPDNHHEEGFYFDQLGVRVPAILISPWAKKSLEETCFDHTSVLKYLIEKWNLADLGERTKQANSIGLALDLENAPRENCLQSITLSDEMLVSPDPHLEKHHVNENQKNIHVFADFLNKKDPARSIPDLQPLSIIGLFKDRVGEVLEHHGLRSCGEWLREEADDYRNSRIDHTLKIMSNRLTMFQPREDVKKKMIADKKENENFDKDDVIQYFFS